MTFKMIVEHIYSKIEEKTPVRNPSIPDSI